MLNLSLTWYILKEKNNCFSWKKVVCETGGYSVNLVRTFSSIIEVNISEVHEHDIIWLEYHGIYNIFSTRATHWLRCFPVHGIDC